MLPPIFKEVDLKSYRFIFALGLIIILLAFIMLIFSGCTTNQFDTEKEIPVTIIGSSNGELLVKYKLGKTLIHDSIHIENLALLADLMADHTPKVVNLLVKISACDCPTDATVSYYQIDGVVLGESNTLEYQVLYDIAKENPDLFNWKWMDGKEIKNGTPKIEELPKKETELL